MDAGQIAVMVTGIVVVLAGVLATALGFWPWLQGKAKEVQAKPGMELLGIMFEKAVSASSRLFEAGAPVFREITADGKVDKAEWARFFNACLTALKNEITDDEKTALDQLTNGKGNDYLKGIIPHAIAESKRRGQGAKAPLVDPSLPQS